MPARAIRLKRIVVKPGAHYRCRSTFIVPSIGRRARTAEVTLNDENRMIHENESIYVPSAVRIACQSGQDSAGTDRSAGRELSRRRRYRAAGGTSKLGSRLA